MNDRKLAALKKLVEQKEAQASSAGFFGGWDARRELKGAIAARDRVAEQIKDIERRF